MAADIYIKLHKNYYIKKLAIN